MGSPHDEQSPIRNPQSAIPNPQSANRLSDRPPGPRSWSIEPGRASRAARHGAARTGAFPGRGPVRRTRDRDALMNEIVFRPATPADALCLGVLSTQVFLDTYALAGIR